MTRLDSLGILEPVYLPLCPRCSGESVGNRFSARKVTREEWEAERAERDAWRESERGRGRLVLSLETPGWDDDWTECWTIGELLAVVCHDCGFSAETDEPFIDARKRRAAARDEVRRQEFERTSALPLDDPEHWCWYCENNAYDSDPCEDCGARGCERCGQHGYVGYSW